MGKITKVMQAKHRETLSPGIEAFVKKGAEIALPLLPAHLEDFPQTWPFPRGDLHHWISLLNRFDNVLERFCAIYKLGDGPQMRDIGTELLTNSDDAIEYCGDVFTHDQLKTHGFREDGDSHLIRAVLRFTRMLLNHCGNRSIYSSSSYLNDILNTTDLSILYDTLWVGSELAQRYQASVKRAGPRQHHLSPTLLQSHYNIDLGRVQELSAPFVKTPIAMCPDQGPSGTSASASKGKDKAVNPSNKTQSVSYANDLVTLATADDSHWTGWGDVKVTYYPRSQPQPQPAVGSSDRPPNTPNSPSTPTPLRLSTPSYNQPGPTPRSSRMLGDDTSPPGARLVTGTSEESSGSSQKTFDVPQSVVAQTSIYDLLSRVPHDAPDTTKYEILNRFRVAKALIGSPESRQKMLAIRLLAITNLAYIHDEATFVNNILRQDSDETRRFQLTYQLAELIHPPAEASNPVPLWLQTVAFSLLNPISMFEMRTNDILSALNVNVSHGILLYVVRKAVAGMKVDEGIDSDKMTEIEEWRNALLIFAMDLATTARVGPELVSAGMMEILIEILNMRSISALRNYSTALSFLDGLIWAYPTAFQAFFSGKGLDAVADLFVSIASDAHASAKEGRGTKPELQSQLVDYEIPFNHQQTLKWLLKLVHHIMVNAYSVSGQNSERLLRNLADKSDLLRTLKSIMENIKSFGAVVWTHSVTVLADFINNDPTSFAAISESGMITTYLEVITGHPVSDEPLRQRAGENQDDSVTFAPDERPHPPTDEMLAAETDREVATGIVPSTEALTIIPFALNSISLNNSGIKMVVDSRAFDSFLEIFSSPRHVKALQSDRNVAASLGGQFDELGRHHPSLRGPLSNAVIDMVARVSYIARTKHHHNGWGANMKVPINDNNVAIDHPTLREQLSSRSQPIKDKQRPAHDEEDVVMTDAIEVDAADAATADLDLSKPEKDGATLYYQALASFLDSYLLNSNLKELFLGSGGLEMLLDMTQAPSLPAGFCDSGACRTLIHVITGLVEMSPAIGLPSLLRRTQASVKAAIEGLSEKGEGSCFAPFLQQDTAAAVEALADPDLQTASTTVKSLLQTQLLIKICSQCFQNSARSPTSQFYQANVYDYYLALVQTLGTLTPALVKEFTADVASVPIHWCQTRRESTDTDLDSHSSPGTVHRMFSQWIDTGMDDSPISSGKGEQTSSRYLNFETAKQLLQPTIAMVHPFIKTLGKCLVGRRERDTFARAKHLALAEGIAHTLIDELRASVDVDPTQRTPTLWNFWLTQIITINQSLASSSAARVHDRAQWALILPNLLAFKEHGGIELFNKLLRIFQVEICQAAATPEGPEALSRLTCAVGGVRKILELYDMLVHFPPFQEALSMYSPQAQRTQEELPLQYSLVLEFRHAILPVVVELWQSPIVEKASDVSLTHALDRIIEILRVVGMADGEPTGPNLDASIPFSFLDQQIDDASSWAWSITWISELVESGFDEELVIEALYRSCGNSPKAREYCQLHQKGVAGSRNPVPPEDAYVAAPSPIEPVLPGDKPEEQAPEDHVPEDRTTEGQAAEDRSLEGRATEDQAAGTHSSEREVPEDHRGEMEGDTTESMAAAPLPSAPVNGGGSASLPGPSDELSDVQAISNAVAASPPQPCVSDDRSKIIPRKKAELDEMRKTLSDNLIDRCLDVIRAYPVAAMEIADLISSTILCSPDHEDAREEVGETLANALSSLAMDDEDRKSNGRSIAAYAHLLALLLQDRPFFTSCVPTLREKVDEYIDFLKVSPTNSQEPLPSWIPYILLVAELLLSHDEQPGEPQSWNPPASDDDPLQQPVLALPDPIFTESQRTDLLDSVLEILPRVGKEEILGTSVLRILVILCRRAPFARRIGEKKNLQRLFVMVKQLSVNGADRLKDNKLTSSVMIILRYIVEDEDIIRQNMRTQIKNFVQVAHVQRGFDLPSYLRSLAPFCLRDPQLFVESTSEVVKLKSWAPVSDGGRQYASLALKEEPEETPNVKGDEAAPAAGPSGESLEAKDAVEDIKETTEDKEMADIPKEAKLPVVGNPDGVIHFLLCELLAYREIDDKDSTEPKDLEGLKLARDGESSAEDQASSSAGNAADGDNKDKKSSKPMFKPDDHPIFIYRGFLLYCLTELLGSYSRAKVEFINFKRSAPTQASTPIKPRSSVMHYLINDFLCTGPSDGPSDGIAVKKKKAISSLAQRLLVALVAKTEERTVRHSLKHKYEYDEDEPDLLFVRKFVLDTILKAYEKASSPEEGPEARYSRMESLAKLMDHMINDKDQNKSQRPAGGSRSQAQLRRMMYEKGYLDKLTSSIAEMDLSYPGVKQTIMGILLVLRCLTQTAKDLSQQNVIPINSLPEMGDDDDVSHSSMSNIHSDREETPDLYRNSALGMLEPMDDDDGSAEDEEDEEMYDEYPEDMDYGEDDGSSDAEDGVSDEDEMEGMHEDHGDGMHDNMRGSMSGGPVEIIVPDPEDEDDDEDMDMDSEDMTDDDDDHIEIVDDDGDNLQDDGAGPWESEVEDEQDDEEEDEEDIDYEAEVGDIAEEQIRAAMGDVLMNEGDLVRRIAGELDAVDGLGMPEPHSEDQHDGEDEDEDADEEEENEDMDFGHDNGLPPGEDMPQGSPEHPWDFNRHYRVGVFGGNEGPPTNDEGANPLLRRRNAIRASSPRPGHGHNHTVVSLRMGELPMPSNPMQFLSEIMDVLPIIDRDREGAIHFQIASNRGTRDSRIDQRREGHYSEPRDAIAFVPRPTRERYSEAAKMVFGSQQVEFAMRFYNLIYAKLIPDAIEAYKKQRAEEAERQKRFEEERQKREQDRLEAEAKEAEEKAVEEKETEESGATEDAAVAIENEAATTGEQSHDQVETHLATEPVTEPMEGVETNVPAEVEPEEGPADQEPQARVLTTIRGGEVDVTELGIDPDYLAALPEEFREEVIAQAVSARRSAAREEASGAADPDTYQEFLNVLPEDLRREIIQQERQEQRRRQQDEHRRQTITVAGGNRPPGEMAADMDTASILLTFPPMLREQVLLEQGEQIIDQLPPEMAAEARRLMERSGQIAGAQPSAGGSNLARPHIFGLRADSAMVPSSGAQNDDKTQRRTVIQMLDKSGVATLLRLMFINHQFEIRSYLFSVFDNVCENHQNRLEVVSTVLQILQDGSTDMEAVERSFGHLSLKAKKPRDKDGEPKTPSQVKRTLTEPSGSIVSHANSEVSPLLIVTQCLDLLVHLCANNPHISSLFLKEHDIVASSIKRIVSRKGKGKESKAHKYAINSLLGLLDREVVMESISAMALFAELLYKITLPLQSLERRRKEAEDALKALNEPQAAPVESSDPATEQRTEIETVTEEDAIASEQAADVPTLAVTPNETAQEATAHDSEHAAPEDDTVAKDETRKQEKKDELSKKMKTLQPPVIPPQNLTLVVRIFVTRECSSKTFQNTLSTIKNLSTIPGAKAVFGSELVHQAKLLGEDIVSDLEQLLPHITSAQSGTDIQGVALNKFSPGNSDQNKLLRVLAALDHLFDSKKKSEQSKDEDMTEQDKQDLVSSLYNSSIFSKMWDKLSACLGAIHQQDNMINIATILLPLIESLMVVCKNTAGQDAAPDAQPLSDLLMSSPAPESKMAGLFFTFTEEHRRILNELVRSNPKLMSGTFALLVKNPKVLEFDNKRNYFNRSVHARTSSQQTRGGFPSLNVQVRREEVLVDSFKSLYYKTGDEIKFGKLNIKFIHEEGVDAGGVTREWFQVLSRGMFNPHYVLFSPVSADRTTFHPNKLSSINPEHLPYFKFIGRIIGKALYEGRVLDCYFSRAVYKRILGKSVSVKDMESFDPDYYKSLLWMLENDITDIITETFSVEDDAFGAHEIHDLVPNGRDIAVTEENKQEYVRLVVEHKLLSSVKEQMEHFLKGFHEIVPEELVAIFTEQELELLISGLPDISVDDWKVNTEYQNYTPSSQQIQWFWRAVRSFDKEERAKLLQFVTGTSKVPLNGFKELEGMNGVSRFNIHRDYGKKERLPSSHTCFNQLDLPEYESYEELRSQLLKAITAGSDYFGFA